MHVSRPKMKLLRAISVATAVDIHIRRKRQTTTSTCMNGASAKIQRSLTKTRNSKPRSESKSSGGSRASPWRHQITSTETTCLLENTLWSEPSDIRRKLWRAHFVLRWYEYTSNEVPVEPPEHLTSHFMARYLTQHWQTDDSRMRCNNPNEFKNNVRSVSHIIEKNALGTQTLRIDRVIGRSHKNVKGCSALRWKITLPHLYKVIPQHKNFKTYEKLDRRLINSNETTDDDALIQLLGYCLRVLCEHHENSASWMSFDGQSNAQAQSCNPFSNAMCWRGEL